MGDDREIKELIWPPSGMVHEQEFMLPVHCKPKLIPLKSVTLEKLEKMQREALEKLRELDKVDKVEETPRETDTGAPTDSTKATDIWKAEES